MKRFLLLLLLIFTFLLIFHKVDATEWCSPASSVECEYNSDCASPHTCICGTSQLGYCSTTQPTSTPIPPPTAAPTNEPFASPIPLSPSPTPIACDASNVETKCRPLCDSCSTGSCSYTCSSGHCSSTCTTIQTCPGDLWYPWGACISGFQTRWCINNSAMYQIQPCATNVPVSTSTPIPTPTTAAFACPASTSLPTCFIRQSTRIFANKSPHSRGLA